MYHISLHSISKMQSRYFHSFMRRKNTVVCNPITLLLQYNQQPVFSKRMVVVGSRYFSDSSNDKHNQNNSSDMNDTKEASKDNQQSNSNNSDSNNNSTINNSEVINYPEINQKLTLEIKELKEKVLRSLAEEENVRRIAKRDVENAKSYANASFAKAMLDVADDLDRALATVPTDKRSSSTDSTLISLIQGIEMTDKNLHKIFNKFGIVKYGAAGDIFDPNFHDALYQIPDSSKPTGSIGQVVKMGYKLKDRVIRAAQVGTYTDPNNN